ncbi:MAG: hypothetical protein IT323_16235, partial [Anaerolineae bacterium]|nr:hypothetical protein [Anaerolineae bacterium]
PDPAGRALHFSYTLWILFPEPVRRVELCLKGAFDAVRGWAASEVLQEIARPAEGRVVLEASGMTWVEVAARVDDAWLGPICYTTEAESAAADQEIRNLERIEANVLHWSSADVLLPPNTYFRLAVTSRATRKRDGVADDEDTYTHYAYFHTDGPPALLPAWAEAPAPDTSGAALSVESYPTGGKLTDLSGYVARCIPAHGQAAVYRAYGLGVEFNENYVQQMYGADMIIQLRDANDQPVVDADGNEVEFLNVWEELPSTSLSITEIPYVTRVQDCVPLSVAGIAPDETLISTYGVRFEETFDGALDNWTDPNAPDGDPNTAWTIAGGMVSLSGAILSPLGALLVAGDAAWTDYAVEAELTETGEEVGLVFRYAGGDTATYYRLRLNAAGRTLERISGGDVLALWQDATPYTPSADQILAVQCFGARIRGQLGMELLFDLSDADALPAGQIGLYTNATAAFAHVLVRDWPGAALAAETLYRAELAGSYVLFQADGWPDDPAAAGWLDLADEDNANQRIVFIGQAEWTDYRLEATLTPVDGAPLGLLVRAQLDGDTFRAYRLYWSAADDSIRFALVSGALDLAGKTYTITERNLLRECRGVACEVDFGLTEHDVSIVCHGAQFSISVDGVQIASVTDGALSGGLIGLYYGGSASAPTGFAEILARSEPRGAVYDWQFVTSAYAGFVEHIDTFAGVVYDDAPGRPDGAAAAAQIVSAAAAIATANAAVLDARGNLASADALTMTQRLGEAHAALAARQQTASDEFEAIFALFVGETYRPLPPVVELTALRGTDGVYALLLDSPEPLDWDRIAVQVKRRGADGQYHDVTASGFFTWNADGTRALFMNAGGAALQGGDFALHLAYQLDIGAEAPVLRRNGSTLPEIAALSFSL